MANILVPRRILRPFKMERRSRNTLLPNHLTALDVGRGVNFATAHCRKVVFQKALPVITEPANGPAFALNLWHWRCRTGEASATPGALKLRAIALGTPSCRWDFVVDDGSTVTTSSEVLHGDKSTAGSINDLSFMKADVDVLSDTVYSCYMRQYASRAPPVSFIVYEVHEPAVDPSDAITVDTRKVFHKAPIYDANMQEMVASAHDVWKHNGSQLFSISRDTDDGAGSGDWTRTTNSYVNMLDDTATTVDSTTPGFNLRTSYLNPYHTNDISAVFAAYGSNANSSGGNVRLQDASGTLGTLSSFGTTSGWLTTAVTLTGGSDQKVDIQFQGDGTNELRILAASLYVYEA